MFSNCIFVEFCKTACWNLQGKSAKCVCDAQQIYHVCEFNFSAMPFWGLKKKKLWKKLLVCGKELNVTMIYWSSIVKKHKKRGNFLFILLSSRWLCIVHKMMRNYVGIMLWFFF